MFLLFVSVREVKFGAKLWTHSVAPCDHEPWIQILTFQELPVGESAFAPFLHQTLSVVSTAQTWPWVQSVLVMIITKTLSCDDHPNIKSTTTMTFPLTVMALYSPSTETQFLPAGQFMLTSVRTCSHMYHLLVCAQSFIKTLSNDHKKPDSGCPDRGTTQLKVQRRSLCRARLAPYHDDNEDNDETLTEAQRTQKLTPWLGLDLATTWHHLL